MAHLIQLRQKIKGFETIKKITHAMRLIAMSSHGRLKTQEQQRATYVQMINTIVDRLREQVPTAHHPCFNPPITDIPHQLIILIGSQKGLCGSFNASLFHFFESTIPKDNLHTSYIVVGKRAVDYVKLHTIPSVIASYAHFSPTTMPSIAHEITQLIVQHAPYNKVSVVSNKPKTFFLQRPTVTGIIPLREVPTSTSVNDEYTWYESPTELLDIILLQALESQMQFLLFQSLLAEQAARFLSMDMSTRNADRALETTKLHYNKLRQAKITKELAELSGSF